MPVADATLIMTRAATEQLGCTYDQLYGLIRRRKLAPPWRDASGNMWWGPEDLERARKALATDLRRKHPVETANQGA